MKLATVRYQVTQEQTDCLELPLDFDPIPIYPEDINAGGMIITNNV